MNHVPQHGEQLTEMSKTGETVSFEYIEDGLRTKKTATSTGTTEYTLHGKNIIHLKNGNDEMHFFYGADNKPAIVVYNGASYRYMYTLQGDVFGLVDESNNFVVWYLYDSWGKPLGIGGSMANTLGVLQPFRYRRYVFDEETGLYYLRSRYYGASWGRFISADALIKGNIYCYCDNNAITAIDPNGYEWVDTRPYGGKANCYAYAFKIPFDPKTGEVFDHLLQPGEFSNPQNAMNKDHDRNLDLVGYTCRLLNAVRSDMQVFGYTFEEIPDGNGEVTEDSWIVALVIDYHGPLGSDIL